MRDALDRLRNYMRHKITGSDLAAMLPDFGRDAIRIPPAAVTEPAPLPVPSPAPWAPLYDEWCKNKIALNLATIEQENSKARDATIRALNIAAVKRLVNVCHMASVNGGWWQKLNDDGTRGEPLIRNVPEMICLIHSELSEAMEAYRKGLQDDKLPHHKGITVELADAVIRIADLAGGLGLDLGTALAEKLEYNAKRADHKPAARAAAGGKAF